jgi:hypothetical protein
MYGALEFDPEIKLSGNFDIHFGFMFAKRCSSS